MIEATFCKEASKAARAQAIGHNQYTTFERRSKLFFLLFEAALQTAAEDVSWSEFGANTHVFYSVTTDTQFTIVTRHETIS